MNLNWKWTYFDELSTRQLYQILQMRETVFIVEQNEVYLDADDIDLHAWHLTAHPKEKPEQLAAYARIMLPHKQNNNVRFGRVLVAKPYRGNGIAKQLVHEIFRWLKHSQFADNPITISAQQYLVNFYASMGFKAQGEIYYEGNIAHVEMIHTGASMQRMVD